MRLTFIITIVLLLTVPIVQAQAEQGQNSLALKKTLELKRISPTTLTDDYQTARRLFNRSNLPGQIASLDFRKYRQLNKSLNQSAAKESDTLRRWLTPVLITLGAGATVFAIYSIRGR